MGWVDLFFAFIVFLQALALVSIIVILGDLIRSEGLSACRFGGVRPNPVHLPFVDDFLDIGGGEFWSQQLVADNLLDLVIV
jgi:hypothetical protein